MTSTGWTDLGGAPAPQQHTAEPARMPRLGTVCSSAVSACAHLGAQRPVRSSHGAAGASRRGHAADGDRRAAVGSGRPRPRFRPGGRTLL